MNLAFWKSPNLRIQMWPLLTLFAVLWMETTALSLWYAAVFEPQALTWTVVFIILLTVFVASHVLARGMEALRLRMLYRRITFGVWVVLAMFISLKLLIYARQPISPGELIFLPVLYILRGDVGGVSFYHLILIGLLVWRGVALARSPVSLTGAQASFQLGLVALLMYGLVFARVHPIEATAGLYEFLFCGLIAMSAARIANLSELRGGRIPRFSPGWVLSLFLAGLALVGLAILAGALISGRILDLIALILLIFFTLLTALTLFVLSPLFALLTRLIPLFSDFLQNLMERLRSLGIAEKLQQLINQMSEGLSKVMPVLQFGRGVILLAMLVVLVLVILLALRLRNLRRKMIEEEEAGAAASENVPGLLQKLLNRLIHDAHGLRLRNPAQILAAARIRQIYRHLMTLSSRLGAERLPSITPLEFLPQVEKLFPEEQQGLQTITGAYLKVRYGEYPETREEVSQVEAAWERIRRQGRRQKAK